MQRGAFLIAGGLPRTLSHGESGHQGVKIAFSMEHRHLIDILARFPNTMMHSNTCSEGKCDVKEFINFREKEKNLKCNKNIIIFQPE